MENFRSVSEVGWTEQRGVWIVWVCLVLMKISTYSTDRSSFHTVSVSWNRVSRSRSDIGIGSVQVFSIYDIKGRATWERGIVF